jgi:predicted nucleic acid-binding protein
LLSVPTEERLVSVLTRVEIETGIRAAERGDVASLFGAVVLVEVSDLIARRAAGHLRRFRKSHSSIDLVDYVVAASAELHDATLTTLNVRQFPMFTGLKPPC